MPPRVQNKLRTRHAKWRATYSAVNIAFAVTVKAVRIKRKWTQKELARRLQVTPRTVKRWESGQYMATEKVNRWLRKQAR